MMRPSPHPRDPIVTDAQTTSKAKKSSWFQVHLSTCGVLMLVAGVLVWANVYNITLGDIPATDGTYRYTYGWPIWTDYSEYSRLPSGTGIKPWAAILCNSTVFVGLLSATAFLCEALIRRRERRKAERVSEVEQ